MSRHEKQCSINSTATTACYCLILSHTRSILALLLLFFLQSCLLDDSHLTSLVLSLSSSYINFSLNSVVLRQLRKKYEKKVKHKIWVNLIYILFSLSLTYLFSLVLNECWWWWCSACQIEVAFNTLFIFNFIL